MINKDKVVNVFKMFDKNNDGAIDIEEIKTVF